VVVRVAPTPDDRFLVLNELYHPAWRAWVDDQPATIYPTNVVMRGIMVPAGASTVELRFVPLLVSGTGIAMYAAGIGLAVGLWWALAVFTAPSPTPLPKGEERGEGTFR